MILEAKNVSYFYKSQKDKLILDNVNYSFECGKMYAILGHSGSGKTTLLSLLAGLDSPVKGEILYDGKPITAKDLTEHRRNHISLVFQSYKMFYIHIFFLILGHLLCKSCSYYQIHLIVFVYLQYLISLDLKISLLLLVLLFYLPLKLPFKHLLII